eukprot:sb/3463241/
MSTPVTPAINSNASDEDKRRHIHNESERKRKNKMAKWVTRLSAIVPDCQPKMSKHLILEKTVQFVEQLKQEAELPNDVQALKAEIVKLTKNVEYLSTENAHFMSLLKHAQSLSRGAWSLNMSITRNRSSSSSEGEDTTTMTPTLDRVSVSNLTKASSAPNLPTIVPVSGTTSQKLYTLPQPIQVTLQPKVTMTTTVGPNLVAAGTPLVSANPLLAGTNLVSANLAQGTPVLAQGTPVLAQGTPVHIAGVQVKDNTVLKTAPQGVTGGTTHSIQALLGDNNANNKTVFLQTASVPTDGGANAVYMTNSPLVAGPTHQTPVLIQGENGPVVIMIPAALPLQTAVPLNTMSSNHIMCEPTSYFKSPIVLNQFPQLLNYQASGDQPGGPGAPGQGVTGTVQVGSAAVIQGSQGQPMVVGTQPVIAQLSSTATAPTMVNVNPGASVIQQGGQVIQQGGQVIQQGGMVGVHTGPVTGPVLIPQVSTHQGGQCFIPMDGHHMVPVQQVTTTLTAAGSVDQMLQTTAPQPPVSRTTNVTDFSISQICQTQQQYNSLAGDDHQSDKSDDIYLSTSDSRLFVVDQQNPTLVKIQNEHPAINVFQI